jgi:hypothetical protein
VGSHPYLDNPTGQPTGAYAISVIVTDKDGGSGSGSTSIQVNNVAPAGVMLTPSSSSLSENGSITLGGSFTDPGTLDTHSVDIDWGDGTAHTVLSLPAGVLSFAGAGHTYLDNPAGQPTGSYPITVNVIDKDGGSSTEAASIQVNNVAPGSLTLTQSATSINEGGPVTLSGSFTDPGTLDTHSVDINWGDRTAHTAVSLAAGVLSFSGATHTYLDNPAGQPNGSYPITVTVTDKDGSSASIGSSIQVSNVAPTVGAISGLAAVMPSQTESPTASFTDPGTLDTHTAVWTWGDGTTSAGTVTESGGSGTVSGTHRYGAFGTYAVTVTITDKDGGASTSATFTASAVSAVYVLDSSAAGALSLSTSAAINVTGGVYVDSSSSTALTASGNTAITASVINVTGGVQ